MTVTRFGPTIPQMRSGALGYDPAAAEPEEPVDLALEGIIEVPRALSVGTPTVVQATFDGGGGNGAVSVTLGAAPTAGNTLILILVQRNDLSSTILWPAGFGVIVSSDYPGVGPRGHAVAIKVSDGTETTLALTGGNESAIYAEVSGFDGELPALVASDVATAAADATADIPAITPATGIAALLIASVWKDNEGPNPGPATLTGYTILEDTGFSASGNQYRLTAWYKVASPTSGTYGPVSTSSGGGGDHSNIIHAALSLSEGFVWDLAPEIRDGDDATYHAVPLPDPSDIIVRAMLLEDIAVIRSVLRIGAASAGSETLDLYGADEPDFSDEVLIGTRAWEATGSYTSDEVQFVTAGAASHQFYRIVGPTDVRIYTWELYATTDATIPTLEAELDEHISDATDAHDASAISIVDAGSFYTGTTVEAALQEIAGGGSGSDPNAELNIEGGQSVIHAHGSTGTTETIDPTLGNVHTLTLDADCTLTLSAPVGSGAATLELWITQDGTGGWDITWPGSVTLQGTLDTTASTTSRVILETIDGGTAWIATVIGGGGGTALTVEDEGTPLATAADTLDFVGAGVTASGTGASKTITIPGVTEASVRDVGRWEPVTDGDVAATELVFEDGDVVMEWVPG